MDEYNEYFRIATQKSWEGTNVYVLDKNFSIAGKLEGIAPGETMHSARFMGDRCYLVTFKKVDPFFVVDLKKPETPKILGILKIPGYSDYLHPYDENHIIGLGKDTYDMESFAWFQGLKLSLFDVTNVNKPVEMDKYIIGDRGTYSPALFDHKAFLFSKSRNILAFPVSLAEINESKYPNGVPPNAYGEIVWQGVYVFDLTLDVGFQLRGRISHLDNIEYSEYFYPYYSYWTYQIERSLYIKNCFYTISKGMVKVHRLKHLRYVNEVDLVFPSN
jgi:uncharacterized secreted protein with C-terminal beta-propeller domain